MITDHLCLYSQQVKYTNHYFCELILYYMSQGWPQCGLCKLSVKTE
jgi:hypothetical protein